MKKALLVISIVMLFVAQACACAAITKKGTLCKRAPSPGSQYCWQHGGTTKAQRAAGLTDADVAKMRCKAITKAGTQCKRTAQSGSDYCWQHAGMQGVKSTKGDTVMAEKDVSSSQEMSERTQCDAITKSGKRCTRKAQSGGTKCWQHAQ